MRSFPKLKRKKKRFEIRIKKIAAGDESAEAATFRIDLGNATIELIKKWRESLLAERKFARVGGRSIISKI